MGIILSLMWIGAWFSSLVILTAPIAWVLLRMGSFSLLGLSMAIPASILVGATAVLTLLHLIYRVIPAVPNGQFVTYKDRGSVWWAIENGLSIPCLRLFQGTLFINETLRYLVLKALRCHVAYSSQITTRTTITNPRKIFIGERCIIGEFAHLSPSLQPRVGLLIVEDIRIGNDVLVGGYCRIAPGVKIGDKCNLQAEVFVSWGAQMGQNVRIGARSVVSERAKIGDNVRIGKDCIVEANAIVPKGTVIPNGGRFPFAQAPTAILQKVPRNPLLPTADILAVQV